MPHRRRSLLALSLLVVASAAFGSDEPADLKRDRLQLADALSRQDMATANRLISDAWSGMRFFSGMPGAAWRSVGQSIAEARWVAVEQGVATFTARRPHDSTDEHAVRTLHFVNHDGVWLLRWESLMGPFPTR